MLFDATQQVSPVTQDYLKAIWQSTEWGGRPATTSSLAARFGTSQASERPRRISNSAWLTKRESTITERMSIGTIESSA